MWAAANMRAARPKLLLEPLLQIGLNELFYLRLFEVALGDERGAGVDALLDAPALQNLAHRLDGQVAHLERVLQNQTIDVALPHRFDELGRAVEADEFDLPRQPRFLQRQEHAEGGGLVGTEDAVDAAGSGLDGRQ